MSLLLDHLPHVCLGDRSHETDRFLEPLHGKLVDVAHLAGVELGLQLLLHGFGHDSAKDLYGFWRVDGDIVIAGQYQLDEVEHCHHGGGFAVRVARLEDKVVEAGGSQQQFPLALVHSQTGVALAELLVATMKDLIKRHREIVRHMMLKELRCQAVLQTAESIPEPTVIRHRYVLRVRHLQHELADGVKVLTSGPVAAHLSRADRLLLSRELFHEIPVARQAVEKSLSITTIQRLPPQLTPKQVVGRVGEEIALSTALMNATCPKALLTVRLQGPFLLGSRRSRTTTLGRRRAIPIGRALLVVIAVITTVAT